LERTVDVELVVANDLLDDALLLELGERLTRQGSVDPQTVDEDLNWVAEPQFRTCRCDRNGRRDGGLVCKRRRRLKLPSSGLVERGRGLNVFLELTKLGEVSLVCVILIVASILREAVLLLKIAVVISDIAVLLLVASVIGLCVLIDVDASIARVTFAGVRFVLVFAVVVSRRWEVVGTADMR
jgi:hypothetical protein